MTKRESGQNGVRGRGAARNPVGRFEPYAREPVDDGWEREEEPTVLRTQVAIEEPRTIIARNTSPDIPFDRSINPYRGCEHGCIYCFARPSHAFLGLSPGLDFETRLTAKPNAPALLRRELSARSYRPRPIGIGTNTDPYQPIEKRLGIMRGVLEVLRETRHPVTIVTKGSLIERDIDILGPMAREGLVHVGISVTTLDRGLSRRMEPRAPAPERRLTVIRQLAEAGVPVRVMVAPVMPGLTDNELEPILEAGRNAGARSASYILLRLPGEVSDIFHDWLDTINPARARRILSHLAQMHDGREYNSDWGDRMRGKGTLADLLERRFALAVRRFGLDGMQPPLRCDLFRAPGKTAEQLELF
ncbi:PA0069 family radical SAM protein [Amaricoccus macauensis]|uniref:PA0069 family radical SAM protein n=1 Tax=Amaricoccus macauensis TaxID=57001 RepID=UPI003C79B5E6